MNAQLILGDVFAGLRAIEDECVQTVITSPPYWALRDYGTATWDGGDSGCDHTPSHRCEDDRQSSTLTGGTRTRSVQDRGIGAFKTHCGKCGAKRIDFQLGLESTPEAYVARMIEVFRAIRRVLRRDGTLWVNMGDTYLSGGGSGWQGKHSDRENRRHTQRNLQSRAARETRASGFGLKPKDLVGMPWRLALALQSDGWYLRQDIIWAKPNPMPESIRDRCTKSHEYLFLLSKTPKYRFNADAISERCSPNTHARVARAKPGQTPLAAVPNPKARLNPVINGRLIPKQNESWSAACTGLTERRNKRSVWSIASRGYKGAHFATFPVKLVEPCVLAGSSAGDLVLDPFAGTATTGYVAVAHGRRFVGIELNPEYAELAKRRCPGLEIIHTEEKK